MPPGIEPGPDEEYDDEELGPFIQGDQEQVDPEEEE